ncbi:MAG: hypothetical protein ACRCUY_11345 [Thermoguttaceae bacterium]
MNDNLLCLADGTQSILLRRHGSDIEINVLHAILRPFRSKRQFGADESVIPTRFGHWYLSSQNLERIPIEGDEIVDSNENSWMILEVNQSPLNQIWQCVARTYNVRFGLDEFVDHLRTAYTKTSGGVLKRGFHTIQTGIPAKFSAKTYKNDSDSKTTSANTQRTRFQEGIFVLIQGIVEWHPTDVFRRNDGSIYRIITAKQPLYPDGFTEFHLFSGEPN